MDAQEIASLERELDRFLSEFAPAFGRREPAAHLGTYVRGQLGNLPRKSIEPMALAAGVPPRTLQQFLSGARWDEDWTRNRLAQIVRREHTHRWAVGVIDETSFNKKGRHTPGVKRQHCGHTGKIDNCVVTVHLSYATPADFRVLLDGELFLPQDWSADRERCRQAGIPADRVHQPKWKLALELCDRAVANGLTLPWLTFDEEYGKVPQFHLGLDGRGQRYVGEVPRCFRGWAREPTPLQRRHPAQVRNERRLTVKSPPPSSIENLARFSPAFRAQPWRDYRIKDTDKGPVVWQVKAASFYLPDEQGRPTFPHWLIVARNALDHQEVKHFVSNAPPQTPRGQLLYVGFARSSIERCFQDDKTELGLDHFEVRHYRSLKRHLIISAVSSLFLARAHQRRRGGKSAVDGLPGAQRRRRHAHGPSVAGGGTPGVSGVSSRSAALLPDA